MATISKSKTKKPKYDAVRAIVVRQLAKEFECTEQHVRASLSGLAKSESADNIRKVYPARYERVAESIKAD